MKPSLSLVCLLFQFIVYSQIIPKNADAITVKDVTFDQVVNSLLDSGYVMEKIDKDFHTLTTDYRKLCKDCLPEITFNVRVKDSVATISGKWRSTGNIFGPSSNKDAAYVFAIKNEKMKVPRMAFQAMKTFALSLNGGVTYLISK
jgi:hypothetical protein